MKPRAVPRSSRSKSQDSKIDDNGPKKTKEKHHKRTPSSIKPLTGKVFYLDLPSNKRSARLENDIQTLGGTVEKFFSKDIRYLVSSKPEARYVHRLVPEPPVPSPESVLSSPRPSSSKEGHRSGSQGPTDAVQVSRGKKLVEKVMKEQERIKINKMLSNALEWGVKIVHIEDMIAYIEKKKPAISTEQKTNPTAVKKTAKPACYGRTSQKHNASRISKPFVKVEDSSRRYRPLYLHMAQMPVCNFNSPPPASPFQIEDKRHSTHGPEGKEHAGKSKHRARERREKKKGGYCECCGVKYDKLHAHLKGEQHRAFVAGGHYQKLDALIAQLPWVFAQEPPTQRVKCSVPISPICVSVVSRDRTEEAGRSDKGGLSQRSPSLGTSCSSQRSPSLGASCSSQRKRIRESLPGKNRDSSEELPYVLESSRSKRGSFMWESCPTLLRALGGDSILHSDKVNNAVATETTPGPRSIEDRNRRRRYRRKRHTPLSSHTGEEKHTDTLGTEAAPSEEMVTLSGLEQDSPGKSMQHKTAHVTQQDSIQGKPVDITHLDITQQVFIQAKLVGTEKQDSSRGDTEDPTQQDLTEEKPVDTTRQESVQVKPVDVTLQDSIPENSVKVTEHQPCRTFKPSVTRRQQLPVRSKKRPVDCEPEQTQNATDLPNPAPNALQHAAECGTTDAFRPLRRRIRAERSWRRGRSLSVRPLPPGTLGVEEAEGSAQQWQDLWQLFQESDDMQEDFPGFAE
ncbi:protein DBF4 homolog A [Alosa pseudoharengus]|uniref:protein DBF4 homolog A n=1 Tax=Alosa pseudoharengus TaxID=34774 RepID=UPI003F88E969